MTEGTTVSTADVQQLLREISTALNAFNSYNRGLAGNGGGHGMSVQGVNSEKEKVDKAMKCFEAAEKMVNEGKVMSAMEKIRECEKLLSSSSSM